MATLKICTHNLTRWLTNVREITELRAFDLPKSPEEGRENRDILSLAFKNDRPPTGVHITDFVSGVATGKVLLIRRERDEAETWVVPYGSCYLMSDVGKTIDRI